MPQNKLHIVLVDHLDGGHHLAFMGLFARSLMQLGQHVSILYPQPEKVRDWLGPKYSSGVKYLAEFKINIKPKKAHTTFDDAYIVFQHWKQTASVIKKIDRKTKVDFVFFNWLDSYLAGFLPAIVVDFIFSFRWSGLYLHPRHMRLLPELALKAPSISDVDRVFLSRNCFAITIHDAGILRKYSERLENKPVLLLPETADLSPVVKNVVADEIRSKAGRRMIVGMIGLSRHQGLLTMLEVVSKLPTNEYFFVFAGLESRTTYSDTEWIEWINFKKSNLENCYFYLHGLKEGSEYNAVFDAIEVPFLVYNDFTSTSNRLTKAAAFKKLVLSSDRYCIAEDVKKYHLGLVVSQGDAEQAAQSLKALREKREEFYARAKFQIYSEINSEKKLVTKFDELISIFLASR